MESKLLKKQKSYKFITKNSYEFITKNTYEFITKNTYEFITKINYRNIVKILGIMIIAFIIINIFSSEMVYASGLLDSGAGDTPFNKIDDSWGQFVNDKYRGNYYLDTGNIGFDIIDKGINGIANVLFSLVIMIAWLGINVFNFCFDSNISETFAKSLEKISISLHSGLFDKFFMIFFMVSLIAILIYFVKRNYAAVITQIIGVALITVMALAVSSSGARNFVIETTNFSKEIGMTLVASLSGESNTERAKEDMIGTLWGNLIHKPWVMLEFDGKVSVDDRNKNEAIEKSKKILSLEPKSDERKEITKQEVKDMSYTGRLASTFILGLITIIKILILILLGVIQIFLQILSNLMIVISPIILLMAIVPFFGGFNLIKWIGEKYLGIQVTIVLLSFVIGALILIDKVVLEFFLSIGANFTIALLIQCVCWILIIVFRKQLVLSFNRLQRKVNGTMAAGNMMRKGLDKGADYGNKAAEKAKDLAGSASEPIKNGAVNLKEEVGRKLEYAARYSTGKAGIAAAKFASSTIDKVYSKLNKNKAKDTETDSEVENNGENFTEDKAKDQSVENKEKVVDIKDKMNNAREDKSNEEPINIKKEKAKEEVNNSGEKEVNHNEEFKTEENENSDSVNLKEEVENKKANREDVKKNNNDIQENIEDKKAEEPKVISFNEARVNKGKEEINSKELKDNLRKDLQKEYRDELNTKKKEEEKIKQGTRAEMLKNKLGVSNSKIKAKERALAKDLNSINKPKKEKLTKKS